MQWFMDKLQFLFLANYYFIIKIIIGQNIDSNSFLSCLLSGNLWSLLTAPCLIKMKIDPDGIDLDDNFENCRAALTSAAARRIPTPGCAAWRRRRQWPAWRRSPSWSAPTRTSSSATTPTSPSSPPAKKRWVKNHHDCRFAPKFSWFDLILFWIGLICAYFPDSPPTAFERICTCVHRVLRSMDLFVIL